MNRKHCINSSLTSCWWLLQAFQTTDAASVIRTVEHHCNTPFNKLHCIWVLFEYWTWNRKKSSHYWWLINDFKCHSIGFMKDRKTTLTTKLKCINLNEEQYPFLERTFVENKMTKQLFRRIWGNWKFDKHYALITVIWDRSTRNEWKTLLDMNFYFHCMIEFEMNLKILSDLYANVSYHKRINIT